MAVAATSVYRLQADTDHFQSFAPVQSFDAFWSLDGRPIRRSWAPVRVRAVVEEDGVQLPAGDFAGLASNVPVFSRRAAEALEPILTLNGELLPLIAPQGVYFAYNVTRLIDAIDKNRSKVVRFSSGRVMAIEKYVFKPDRLVGATIFKDPFYYAEVYVTDAFVEAVTAGQLTGFAFEPLWGAASSQRSDVEQGPFRIDRLH
jgi:uncharacterized protein DUF1629